MGPKMKCPECRWVGGDHSGDDYDDDDEDW
jgi:hypothetical protein